MKYYFFFEDIAALELTMEEHRKKIQELGKEQGEMARQTTEIFGHDDACQEAVHDARTLVISRLNNLREIINNAVTTVKPDCQVPGNVTRARTQRAIERREQA